MSDEKLNEILSNLNTRYHLARYRYGSEKFKLVIGYDIYNALMRRQLIIYNTDEAMTLFNIPVNVDVVDTEKAEVWMEV